MRKGTQAFVSILSLGLVAAGYQAGQAAEVSTGFSAAPAAAPVTSETPTSPEPTSSATPTAVASSTAPATVPEATTAPAPVSTPKATTAPLAASPAPVATPKATTAPAAPAPSSSSVTKTGSAINYRFGTIQVSVTKANGKITAVNLLQAGATGGRQSAFSYLVDYAISANGTSFGNLGGATFTVDAFKQSLESALAKF